MSDNKKITIDAPLGYEFVRRLKASETSDLTMLVAFEIKPTKPNPHAALIAQCEDDKRLYPEFWKDLSQWTLSNADGWMKIDDIDCFNYKNGQFRQHPHRASIIEFHQCSDEDKKRWQFLRDDESEWCNEPTPTWIECAKYRLRPRTCQITINGKVLEYPEPVRDPLFDEQGYFLVDVIYGITRCFWDSEASRHYTRLNAGLIQLTQQGAQQHLEVLQAVNALLFNNTNNLLTLFVR